jgi:hypothetical protein
MPRPLHWKDYLYTFVLFGFQSFDIERTWWWLFRKHAVRTTLDTLDTLDIYILIAAGLNVE